MIALAELHCDYWKKKMDDPKGGILGPAIDKHLKRQARIDEMLFRANLLCAKPEAGPLIFIRELKYNPIERKPDV